MTTQLRRFASFAAVMCPGFLLLLFATFLAAGVCAQSNPPAAIPQLSTSQAASPAGTPAAASSADAPEVNTQESAAPFRVRVNLVPVRVVVRDAQGHAVANLRKEDFQIYEDGKAQDISTFSVETPASSRQKVVRTESTASQSSEKTSPDFEPPARFIALLFDDAHSNLQDLVRARLAASKFVDASMQSTDRIGVFTISGQTQSDFTSDRAKLHDTLAQIQPRAVEAGDPTGADDCPSEDYYEADLIQEQHDSQALATAAQDALACAYNNDSRQTNAAQALAQSTAARILNEGDNQTIYSVRRLSEIVQQISTLPGQRTVVLISPGFIFPTRELDLSEIIDRANRANVFINTLDLRGLYTPEEGPDISRKFTGSLLVAGQRESYRVAGQEAQILVLLDLSDGTGGLAFHNNNDLDAGFRTAAATPEVSYLLGFTPNSLKYVGKFHVLKVKLSSKDKYALQARRGFYAPKHGETPEEAAAREIEDAIFSRDEEGGLPLALHTQFYMADATDAKLAVLARVDVAKMHFVKVGDRNDNNLIVVAALFDGDGNYVTGNQQTIEMHLFDATLERMEHTGLTVKTGFDVKPGDYLVRLVVRDENAAVITTKNGAVEIPY
ncbi:MAG: VWA domain-containing protein [Candidatus Acidiferrales bacterium]